MEMEMENLQTMYIPNDIMVRILVRVPARSLFRLRGTCKYWLKLITRDDDFIKMHLHHSTTSHDLSVLISTLASSSSSKGVKQKNFQCYLNCTTASLSNPKLKIAYPFKSYYGRFTCINGLVFVLIKEEELGSFCIWNPCTNDYRVVPNSTILIQGHKRVVHKYGFGYDHTVNDYKVVRTDCYYDGNGSYFVSDIQIYSLARNSWRSIGPYPYQLGSRRSLERYWQCGIFVNGALYWMHSSKKKIISFDIVKEKYKEVSIKQPKCSHGNWCPIGLQALEGSLCMRVVVSHMNTLSYLIEMWMMSDHDIEKNEYSWTKLFRTQLSDFLQCIPLRLTKNDEILMLKKQRHLVLCDLKTYKTSKICKVEKYQEVDAVYIESLVSLNSFMNLPKKKTIM